MEEDQQLKHMCKLCNKSFPCGRSLGGHMRSHVIYPTDQEKPQKMKKLPSDTNGTGNNPFIDAVGYGLRGNPKKTCRFKDSSEDTLLHDKLCRECGKAFQSWKALFGHMKCHSDKITHTRPGEQDSWTSADHSDNGKANPNRKKRSSRRTKRYNNMDITANSTSSSLSFNANASSSVSEIEQEQEEDAAISLIMLSKDLSHWGGLNFIGESSNNNSDFIGTEFCATEDGPKMDRSEAQVGGLIVNEKLNSQVVEELEFQVSEVEMQKNLINKSESDQKAETGTKKRNNSNKRKRDLDLFDPESGGNYSEMCKENFGKKSKFECASCNKAFNTYQALGGHRASHKKMKGCFGLKPDSSETTIIGTDQNLSPNPTADKNSPIDQEMAADTSNGTKKKEGSHKCPTCFRVFSSGQALGGHKRSHLIAEAKNNQNATSIVIQKPIPEIRDFLDLNLPAPDEEDSNTSGLGFNPWSIGTNHKHELLLDLL